jgi:Ca-activated chloride channel family protein
MKFAQPQFLWLLLAFPPGLLVFFWWAWRRRQALMQQFVQARLLPNLTVGLSPARQKCRMACLVAAVACLIFALARPQWGFTWEEVRQRGLDIVVALDTSKSMLATDLAPNRLARAKLAVLDLLRQAKADRLGLVAFAGVAFLQCPLTLDDTAFRQSLDALDVNIIPQGGTALAEAIDTALTAFKETDNYKVLVLLTDGEDHDTGALEAAERAAQAGLRIFTIGVGTADGELVRVRNAQGQEDYVRDEQGNVVKSHLNAPLLRQIASATEEGLYLPLEGTKVMETLYERRLAPLPKSESGEKFIRRYHERFHWPLALGVVLLALELLWPEAKRVGAGSQARPRLGPRPPARENRPPALGPVARATVIALLFAASGDVLASPSSALRDYEAGRFDESLKGFQESIKRKSDDPRLRFNAGAAAYRNGQFDEAAKQFGQVATAPDLKLQEHAYYNLGNAHYRSGEAIGDPQKMTQSWQEAVKQYERALKLNTNNADAKFNRDFVKRRLEELKQQQQQDQKQNPKDQSQDQQQQQSDSAKQDQSQDSQQQQNDPQQQQQNQQSPQPKQDSTDSDQRKQEQQKEQRKPAAQPEQKPPQPQDKADEKAPPTEEEQREAQAMAAGQMTPEQARQLLDSVKGDERVFIFRPKPEDRARPVKDW